MPYFVYIIRSQKNGKYYIGQTKNIEFRLQQHNEGLTNSLRNKGPFELIYKEEYHTRFEAIRRERQIKAYKGGNAFRSLIERYCGPIV